jgi:Holliday junction resolvase
MEDENGNIVPEKYEKNSAKEFSSIKSSINYFDKEINDLIEGARKFGGDPSYMINFLTDIQNFFKNYQSKEQENQYQILGNQN